MPVTIGTLTSSVTVTSGRRGMTEEQLAELARLVAEWLRRESQTGEGNEIPERMSEGR